MDKGKKDFLSVIIINYNGRDYLKRTLSSLKKELANLKLSSEIIIVDNASTDGSLSLISEEFSGIKLIPLSQNFGFARAANIGARASLGEYLLFLNHDVEILPNFFDKLIAFLSSHANYAVATPAVLNPDGSFQLSFGFDLNLFSEFFLKYFAQRWFALRFRFRPQKMSRDIDWASGVALLIRRQPFFEVGGFDERYFLYVEDADLGLRLRQAGYKIRYLPEARIIHHRGATASKFPRLALVEAKKGQLLYYSLHNSRLSFLLLKAYLLSQFKLKSFLTRFSRNNLKRSIYLEVIETIQGFTHASNS
ncbi:MAG: glycosyltransferase family 2 protein [Candidatus Aminicenantes bacterium]|nr:glycosyltransferase family 2 protein [Candidatus Aminicenantes bacterium]